MEFIQNLLVVALGSVIGGVARFWVSGVVARAIGETFPWGTMTVNVTGAFAIGLLGGLESLGDGLFVSRETWLFAVTGFLGCYTTVSSFALQTLALAQEGDLLRASGNYLMSVAICLGSVVAGFALTSSSLWPS